MLHSIKIFCVFNAKELHTFIYISEKLYCFDIIEDKFSMELDQRQGD